MADSIRQRLIDALKTRLSGYSWTMFIDAEDQTVDPTVFAGRSVFDPASDPLPVIAILPGLESSQKTRYRTNAITMPVDVSALVSLSNGANAHDSCEPIFAEMHKACFSAGQLSLDLGTTETPDIVYFDMNYTGGGIADYPTEIGPAIVTVVVSLEIFYETQHGDPYS